MKIIYQTLADLTLDITYLVKWSRLQSTPDYIVVTAVEDGYATIEWYNETGETLLKTASLPITEAVFEIDLIA